MSWFLDRKVEYFPFEIILVKDGYIRGKNPALGWYFKNLLFYYTNGFEYSLRRKDDMEDLRKFFDKNLDEKFAERLGKEIRRTSDNFMATGKKVFKNKENLKKYFNEFCDAMIRMFEVFQMPAFAQLLVPEKDKNLLYKFGMNRDYAARNLAKVDIVIRERMSKILGMPKKVLLMMLPNEIKTYLEKGELPKDLKDRKTCAILTLNRKTKIYWNEEADKIFYDEYKKHLKMDVKEMKGQIAYKGIVQGKVYVAENEDDFNSIPKDSILMCSMTRYNIVPQLNNVKGIVTDQGGITCHAAIIAREVKVPTIVGTRKATEVFKTGDYVEVNAINGVVKKL